MKITLLTAAAGGDWEARLVLALEGGEHDMAVVRRCVDVVELLAVAASGQGQAVLVTEGLRRLDADAIDRLAVADVAVVGVVRRGDAAAIQRLAAIGVSYVVPDDAAAEIVAAVVTEAVAAKEQRLPRGYADPAAAGSMSISSSVGFPGSGFPVSAVPAHARGDVIAVWGPTGAPGRSTVALGLADEVARQGHQTLLIDADVYGGVQASALGLLDESPGLAAACRQAAAQRLDAAAVAALSWQLNPTLRVLTGLPRADRWPELRPAAVEAVISAARELAAYTVLDCGFNLETDEELSFDTVAPRRNGATLAALDAADVIVAVGSADSIGMQRLVRGLTELQEAEVSTPVWVVINRVRSSAVPGDTRTELTAALQRFAGRAPAALLPYDLDSLDAAMRVGKTLAEARPRSPLRAALIELAAALAGSAVGSGVGAHARS